jgi:urea transport system permease protein
MPDATSVSPETPPQELTGAAGRAYRASQTFLSTMPSPGVVLMRWICVVLLTAFFFIGVPVLVQMGVVPDYQVRTLGKYLSFTLVALGIDLIWGYTGILSLCQAFFFCLGAYAMSMHLSLPQGGGIYARPQFMDFAYYGHKGLPFFWLPFQSFTFALLAGIFAPAIVAAIFGFFIFRSRVRGVCFSIVTQAVALGMFLLFSRNEVLLGGTNGLTNFFTGFAGSRAWILGLYWTTLISIVIGYLICRLITKSRLGKLLIAIRDKETRLYFAGYRPYTFKVFAFAVAGALAGVGGMLYAPQTGIVTPQNMDVATSIVMVIWVALGGRGKLWGAIFGTLFVNYIYSAITSDMPSIWQYVQGAMFIVVVLLFPDGIVGIWDSIERKLNSGMHPLRALLSLVSLAALTVFVLAEALGLIPAFLKITIYSSQRIGELKLMYVLLVAILVVIAIAEQTMNYLEQRNRRAAASEVAGTPNLS